MGIELQQLLDRLDFKPTDEQMDILQHKGAPLNVLSCAGSGKTTTIIVKLLAMEIVEGINPKKILAITFSRKGAEEMKYRHEQLCKKIGIDSRVEFSTFHAFYLKIISNFKGRPSIMDEKQSNFALRRIGKKHIRGFNSENLDNLTSLMGYCINNLLLKESEIIRTSKYATSGIDIEDYKAILRDYSEFKKENKQMDFDDLQLCMYQLIKRKEVQDYIHNNWTHFLVDEYQDVSKLQLEILKGMVADPNNLIAIGDDDQCIYEWRGSKIDYIIDMPIHFKNTKRIVMDTNFRCPEGILAPIINSISKNSRRVNKRMIAYGEGGNIELVPSAGNIECSKFITEDIINSQDMLSNLGEIAILYRNNKQPMYVIDLLLRNNIPVQVRNMDSLLYNHFVVEDIKSIVLFALNQTNPVLFKKVAPKILRYVNRYDIDNVAKRMTISSDWFHVLNTITDRGSGNQEVKQNLDFIEKMVEEERPFHDVLDFAYGVYEDYIDFVCKNTLFSKEEFLELWQYMKMITANDNFDKFYNYLERAKSLVSTFSKSKNAVKVMTMHTVKGLEFERVYILNDSEEHCPSSYLIKKLEAEFGPKEVEEYLEQERRLHYVAWTRAKKELKVTFDKTNPSRFLAETTLLRDYKKYPSVSVIFPDEVKWDHKMSM